MNKISLLVLMVSLACHTCHTCLAFTSGVESGAQPRPNVILIVCDDLNDWVGPLGGHPQARTPNLDRFAATATNFTNAACSTPVCAPSRSSFLTGIEPHTSGNLFWKPWHENEILANSKTLMHHFRDNGYRVEGAGKLMHHQRPSEWDALPLRADYGPVVMHNDAPIAHPAVREPFASIGSIDGSFGPLGDPRMLEDAGPRWVYGRKVYRNGEPGVRVPFEISADGTRDRTPDERVAEWAAQRIEHLAQEDADGPFFLGLGFIRPHTPMHAPDEFFDMFPLDEVEIPQILLDDERDTHYRDHFLPSVKGLRYHRLITESYGSREAGLRAFTRAYLACTAFVDHQIGRVLDAIERSPFADNTVVIITSDHGFNMGEKAFLFKNSLWEESARVPLLIRTPGMSNPGSSVEHPVSLIDIYPTLVDLCGLEGDTRKTEKGRPLDGHSLRSLIEDPSGGVWDGPDASLTMLHADEESTHPLSDADYNDPAKQHWSLRSARYRYIRYSDGREELYDHHTDPNEWVNLLTPNSVHSVSTTNLSPDHRAELDRMRARLSERVGVPMR